MRRIWVFFLAVGCGGSGQNSTAARDRARIAELEEQVNDMQEALKREKAARDALDKALVDSGEKCRAVVASAQAAAAAAAATPATPATPGMPATATAPAAPATPVVVPKPVPGKILEKTQSGSDVRLMIGVGRKRGVAEGWSGEVFQGKTTKVLAKFKITKVYDGESEGLIRDAKLGTLDGSERVQLIAPAPPPP